MPIQNLLRLLLLLMLVMTTVWCRFGRWSLVIKLSFCSDFEHKVSRFGQDFEVDVQANFLKLKFGQYIAADAWLWLLSSILVEILKLGLVKKF